MVKYSTCLSKHDIQRVSLETQRKPINGFHQSHTNHFIIKESKTDDIKLALNEFEGEFDEDEIRLYRLKFLSEVAN